MGQGFGPVQHLTSAQILFLALAGMEDAQIQAGNGLVDRGDADTMRESTSVADYFAARRATKPGTMEFQELQTKREKQAGLRKLLDNKVRALVQEDMRFR